jgi:hypothetical protein
LGTRGEYPDERRFCGDRGQKGWMGREGSEGQEGQDRQEAAHGGTIPAAATDDPARRKRFRREARAGGRWRKPSTRAIAAALWDARWEVLLPIVLAAAWVRSGIQSRGVFLLTLNIFLLAIGCPWTFCLPPLRSSRCWCRLQRLSA